MAVQKVSQMHVSQKHVPIIVSYVSFDQKEFIAQLKLDNDLKIQEFIKTHLNRFEDIKEKNPLLYGLRLKSTNQYINEKNRFDLLAISETHRFHEVELCFNLETEVKHFIEKITSLKISSNAEAITQQLISIQKYIESDQLFAFELFAKGGKRLILDYIKEADKISDLKKRNLLFNLYKILMTFIQKWQLISWDRSEIDLPVIQLICDTINDASKENKKGLIPDDLVLLFLEIIDDILNNSQQTRELMLRELKFGDIVFLIQRQNSAIKETLLTLFNKAFKETDSNFKKNLFSIFSQPQHITLLREACKDDRFNNEIILKNFEILQKNILDIDLGRKLNTPADQAYQAKLRFICEKAFETSTGESTLTDEEKFTRLGFMTPSDPLQDFKTTPPGVLPLEFMVYFAEKPAMRQTLYDFASEKLPKNSEYSFPFAKASIGMIKLLCKILCIDEKKEVEENFQILFLIFTLNNDGIYEFFAKSLCLFAKIWSEMKAQSLDFDRALFALRDSLYKIALDANKSSERYASKSCQAYKRRISDFNANIEMWKYDNLKTLFRNDKSNREPIKQLEKILTEQVQQMIKPKRMNVLLKGERFDKVQVKDKKPTKQKQIWKLSSDLKIFTVTDYDNNGEEFNTSQIHMEQIRSVRKEEIKNRQYFALNISGEQTFLLGCQNEEIVDAWQDAIEMLINSKPSANIACFVNCLIDTQLLDLQTLGFDIPNSIPKVPELPNDFNFNYIQSLN